MFCLLFVFLMTSGVGCKITSPEAKQAAKPITLEWWRVWDSEDTVSDIISVYKIRRPNVTINYRQLRFEEYEKELLDAWAEGRGPDIFSVHNTWVGNYEGKLFPLPEALTVPEIVPTGPSCARQETKTVLRTYKTPRVQEIDNKFVQAAVSDAVKEGKILALPLSLDTLVLYYNKDLLDSSGIPTPPKTWDELSSQVKRLTVFNEKGEIIQAGAAFGRASNVDRAIDILALLMMQSGAVMIDNGSVAFHRPHRLDSSINPGLQALRFYTDFANPTKESFTWDESQPRALDAFIQGRAAFFFGYAFHLPLIRARAPKLNFGIAQAPQLDPNKPVNIANYWLEGVFARTEHPNEAWDFLLFAASKEQAGSYLQKANKPTALRELVSKQLEDADLSVFVSSVLTSKSWYTGKDGNAMEQIMKDMIGEANDGITKLEEILRLGAERVQRTL